MSNPIIDRSNMLLPAYLTARGTTLHDDAGYPVDDGSRLHAGPALILAIAASATLWSGIFVAVRCSWHVISRLI